jgi:hypothetical protein
MQRRENIRKLGMNLTTEVTEGTVVKKLCVFFDFCKPKRNYVISIAKEKRLESRGKRRCKEDHMRVFLPNG